MPSPIPIAAQIACIEHEITRRICVYPGLVRKGTTTQARMDHELSCMQAVLATLERLARPGQVELFATREEH